MALWFGVSIPLVFLGSFIGFKRKMISSPVEYNLIPKQIGKQPWYLSMQASCLIGGAIPFFSILIEL